MVLMLMVTSTSALKGGAKSAMRNRGRGGGRGRGSNVRRGYSDNGAGGVDSLGGGSGRKACIGLCYLRNLQGRKPLPKQEERKPCVGLCYLKKLKSLKKGN